MAKIKRVVIDTNILVSSTLSTKGKPTAIMDLISYKKLQLFYCPEILDEYVRVLAYEKLNLSEQAQYKAII